MSSPHCLRGFLIAGFLFLSPFVFSCDAKQEKSKINSLTSLLKDPPWDVIQKALEEKIGLLYKKVTDRLVTVENFISSAYQKVETSIYNAVNESSFVHQVVEIFQEATGTIL